VVTAESRGRVLVDSDVVIDHIRGAQPLPNFPLAFSVITRCELFAGRDDPQYLRKLLAPMHEIPLDTSIAERGGVLKRTVQLQTPDALIAATALEHELALMTRNRRHFDRVPGLTLCHPRDPAEPTNDVEQPAS
jgi:predicted nucleic acid-binding protein